MQWLTLWLKWGLFCFTAAIISAITNNIVFFIIFIILPFCLPIWWYLRYRAITNKLYERYIKEFDFYRDWIETFDFTPKERVVIVLAHKNPEGYFTPRQLALDNPDLNIPGSTLVYNNLVNRGWLDYDPATKQYSLNKTRHAALEARYISHTKKNEQIKKNNENIVKERDKKLTRLKKYGW